LQKLLFSYEEREKRMVFDFFCCARVVFLQAFTYNPHFN